MPGIVQIEGVAESQTELQNFMMVMMMGRGEIVYSSLSRQSEGGVDRPLPRIRTAAFKDLPFDGLRNHQRST